MLVQCAGAGFRKASPLNSSQPPFCTLIAETMPPKSMAELAELSSATDAGEMYEQEQLAESLAKT